MKEKRIKPCRAARADRFTLEQRRARHVAALNIRARARQAVRGALAVFTLNGRFGPVSAYGDETPAERDGIRIPDPDRLLYLLDLHRASFRGTPGERIVRIVHDRVQAAVSAHEEKQALLRTAFASMVKHAFGQALDNTGVQATRDHRDAAATAVYYWVCGRDANAAGSPIQGVEDTVIARALAALTDAQVRWVRGEAESLTRAEIGEKDAASQIAFRMLHRLDDLLCSELYRRAVLADMAKAREVGS